LGITRILNTDQELTYSIHFRFFLTTYSKAEQMILFFQAH